jgi:hypothetical protein
MIRNAKIGAKRAERDFGFLHPSSFILQQSAFLNHAPPPFRIPPSFKAPFERLQSASNHSIMPQT